MVGILSLIIFLLHPSLVFFIHFMLYILYSLKIYLKASCMHKNEKLFVYSDHLYLTGLCFVQA
jgi:hypothetical protein